MFAHSWLLFPLLALLVCLGCGLLLDRLAGGAVPRALLLPCGFATAIVVVSVLTYKGATAELAAPAVAACAAAGLLLGVRGLGRPRRDWLWPLIAGGGAFAAVAAPVVLTGQAGFTGYARIVDIAYQLELVDHLVHGGRDVPYPDSAATQSISNILSVGYPTGSQAYLGAQSWLAGLDPMWGWQPFLALMAAMLGLSLYGLLTRAIDWAPGRAVAATVAAQPTVLFAYTLSGGIKELAAAAMLALLAALLAAESPAGPAPWRRALPALVALAAGFAVFSVGIVPWAGALLVLALAPKARHWRPSRPSGRAVVAVGVLVLVAVVPLANALDKLVPLLRDGGPTADGSELGNLSAPIPEWSVTGTWITQDHRFPLAFGGHESLTKVAAVLIGLLAAAGLVRAALRRDRVLLATVGAGAIGMMVVVWRGNAWVDLKAVCVTAPLLLALAFSGAPLLRRPGALVAGLLVAAAVLAGNGLHYQGTTLSPTARLRDLDAIADRYPDVQHVLMPTFEEHAEYLLRRQRATTLAGVPPNAAEYLVEGADPALHFSRDLDDYLETYIDRFDMIVQRRDPTQSRPSSDFRLAERTRFYDVWRRRVGRPKVVLHLGLDGQPAQRRTACRTMRSYLRRAGSPVRVAYADPPTGRVLVPVDGQLPPAWLSDGPIRLARGPGRIRVSTITARAGTWDVLLNGSFGRRVRVSVDGREVGNLRWRESYPAQYEPVGRITLPAGRHRFEVQRGGGSLLPGTGNDLSNDGLTTRIGPLALVRHGDGRRPFRVVSPEKGIALCASSRPLDWLDVVTLTPATPK